jgi:hypothetical protein
MVSRCALLSLGLLMFIYSASSSVTEAETKETINEKIGEAVKADELPTSLSGAASANIDSSTKVGTATTGKTDLLKLPPYLTQV